jgi:hypothetical protein
VSHGEYGVASRVPGWEGGVKQRVAQAGMIVGLCIVIAVVWPLERALGWLVRRAYRSQGWDA